MAMQIPSSVSQLTNQSRLANMSKQTRNASANNRNRGLGVVLVPDRVVRAPHVRFVWPADSIHLIF